MTRDFGAAHRRCVKRFSHLFLKIGPLCNATRELSERPRLLSAEDAGPEWNRELDDALSGGPGGFVVAAY
jgi:hypothetical protein